MLNRFKVLGDLAHSVSSYYIQKVHITVCFWGVFSRSGALKAANLQQCIGTAEGSPMGLGDEWAYNREWPE